MNLFNLDGQVAVITGAAGAIGSALATGLARAGVKTALLGRTFSKLERLSQQMKAENLAGEPFAADVLDQPALEKASEDILAKWGRIDLLLNVAGGNMAGATIGPDQNFFDLSMGDFDRVVDLNLKGSVLPTFVFAEAMAQRKQGVIINISSMTAAQPFTRVVGYSAAKAGIDNFTRWLAVEMAIKYGEGIRVNAIAPGVFIGRQNYHLLYAAEGKLSERGKRIIDHTPMQRFGEPEELVGTAIWLCSPASKFVTGVVVPVDGGFSAYSGI